MSNSADHAPMEPPAVAGAENPPVLSSEITFFYKFLLPAPFILMFPVWLFLALSGKGTAWIPALLWGGVSLGLIAWARPLKFAEIKGDHLSVSNSVATHLIPARDLYFMEVDRDTRTPSITLYFNPPTPFGKSIRILPPNGRNCTAFDRAARWLQSQPNCRSSHPF